MNARKIIIDTDPAIGIPGTDADDPIAIMLALQDPRLDLLAITTVFGNCPPIKDRVVRKAVSRYPRWKIHTVVSTPVS